MRGFSAERTAAIDAIETLRHEAVRAEDFGAKPHSSQLACLEGVRGSEIYVGVFGERYGDAVASGLSPTEEEFHEARKRGLPILCFITKGAKEPRQEEFLRSITGFEDGYFVAFYSSTDDLGKAIIRALNDLSTTDGKVLDSKGADQIFRTRFDECCVAQRGSVSFRMALIPERHSEEYFSPIALGSEELKDKISQLLLFGPKPRFFTAALGVEHTEGDDYVRLHQENENRGMPGRSVTLFHDAAIFASSEVQRESSRTSGFLTSHIIDEEIFVEKLQSFVQIVSEIVSLVPQNQLLANFFFSCELSGIGDKYFGKVPSPAPNSMSMPGRRLHDPLSIPKEPLRVSRSKLTSANEFVADIVERTARTFRVAGAYYMKEVRDW